MTSVFGSSPISLSAGTIARQTERDATVETEIGSAQIIMRQRIEGMIPVSRLDTRDPTLEAGGNDRTFDFHAVPPVGDSSNGVQKYRLMMTSAGDLVLFHASELSSRLDLRDRGTVGWTGSLLLSGVSSLAIAYYGATRDDPERKWRSFWQNESHAPEVVRIRIAFPPGDQRVWPDMLVRPAATVDLACDPEKNTGKCGVSA